MGVTLFPCLYISMGVRARPVENEHRDREMISSQSVLPMFFLKLICFQLQFTFNVIIVSVLGAPHSGCPSDVTLMVTLLFLAFYG